MTASPSVQT